MKFIQNYFDFNYVCLFTDDRKITQKQGKKGSEDHNTN